MYARGYPSGSTREPRWRLWGTAFIARMASTVESIMRLVDDDRQMDTGVLLRTLYENMVVFAWISIDPEVRIDRWVADARVEMRKMHNDAEKFGIEVLTPTELEVAKSAKSLPPLADLALEVDEYWSARLPGFRVHPQDGPKNLLTIRGLYAGIYRVVSRSAHASRRRSTDS